MGKGKGKLAGWATELPAGIIILELKNLRYGRSKYFIQQLMYKIPTKTRLITRCFKKTHLILQNNTRIPFDTLW